jgi:molybdopterin synthase sulfur carrier subunit
MLDVPADVQTVDQLITWLQTRGPGHQAAFAAPEVVRCAIDQELVGPDAMIAGAGEIAFFPPVTGG